MIHDEMPTGREWDPATGNNGNPATYDFSSNAIMIAPPGSGKGACVELPALLLLHLKNTTIVSVDPTGQNAAISAKARLMRGSAIRCLNPMGLHVGMYPDLESVGCNPMIEGIDPKGPRFYEEAVAIADCFNWSQTGDTFFPDAGRDLATLIIMWVRLRDGDDANLSTVLELLMEGDETDEDGNLIKGLRHTAAEMAASGVFQIAALAGRFLKENRTIDGITQTARTAARSLLSDSIRHDLSKNGMNLADITKTVTTVYLILPAEDLEFHAIWLKLMVTCGLNAIYRQAGAVTNKSIFMLSEFFSLGKLRAVQTAVSAGPKYGSRIFPVLQDYNQLVTTWGREGALTFIASSGCVIAFAPADPETAKFLSDLSGEHFVTTKTSNENASGEVSDSYRTEREKIWSPDAIRSLPKFHALVWKAAERTSNPSMGKPTFLAPQPVYMQPYFKNTECMSVARPDPYPVREGTPAKASQPRNFVWNLLAVTAAVVAFVVIWNVMQ
jgi:type IV secretion system protein VirD4